VNPSVLVVEDEENIRDLVSYTLLREGYQVTAVSSGEEAMASVMRSRPALILLDVMLPGVDGLHVCRRLRHTVGPSAMAIVMLTAKGEDGDVVAGLNAGANDYITKPFSRNVLLARVRAALRNIGAGDRDSADASGDPPPVRIHNIAIDPRRHVVLVDDRPVDLSATEFRLLQSLSKKPGWVLTRGQILEAVRGDGYAATARAVDVQVLGLRKKLGSAGKYVETVRGVGYRLKE
jgi:two-component system alkaline phosphatase synthesis response regulator PhoP